jgi:phytoene dehydrogenase-like protein
VSSVVDAVVVGAGPNGLSAAITIARAGRSVLLVEANDVVGGGVRSSAFGRAGFVHDVCSAVYPMGVGSPFFRSLPLAAHGLEWLQADVPVAHPLDGGRAAVLNRSLSETTAGLGEDGAAYAGMTSGLVELWQRLATEAEAAPGGPTFSSLRSWKSVRTLLRALPAALRSARGLGARFRTDEGKALVAGLGAHGMQPLTGLATAGFVLSLGAAAHAVGWPIVRGGAQRLAEALAGVLRASGGTIETGRPVRSLAELPASRVLLLDVSPAALLRLGAERLPSCYRRRLAAHRHGPATFKVDYVLERPIPWSAEACRAAGVVHVGGSAPEIALALAQTAAGQVAPRPFVLVAQPSLLDRGRVPPGSGQETAWAYCHLPRDCTDDMTGPIEAQLERFAPGFKQSVVARHALGPADLENHNRNLEGGDIGGGPCDLRHLLLGPALRLVPWTTPDPRIFLCSASTPPGPGVHGLCGYFAARAALRALGRPLTSGR